MSEFEFEPVEGCHYSKRDVVIIGPEIVNLTKKYDGVTPEQVRDESRAPTSPLHPYFIWDDHEAAEAQRLDTARYMLRSIKVTIQTVNQPPVAARRLVCHIEEGPKSRYRLVTEVMTTEQYRVQVLEKALKELNDWHKRYEAFKELADIFVVLQQVQQKLGLLLPAPPAPPVV